MCDGAPIKKLRLVKFRSSRQIQVWGLFRLKKGKIDLVGIGAMTRMAEKARRVADAIRSAGVRWCWAVHMLRKPNPQPHPAIPWESLDLDQFNFFPRILHPLLSRDGLRWRTLQIVPLESGRGCTECRSGLGDKLRTIGPRIFTSFTRLAFRAIYFRKQPASMDRSVF